MSDPVEMRRQLRLELRRLRNEAERTQRQVAEQMDWSNSKVIRIEKGEVGISVTDLRALLDYYELESGEARGELEELARNSKRQPFEAFRRILPGKTVRYFEYERTAGTLRHFEPLVIPGLLQIDGYVRALQQVMRTDSEQIDQIIATREERREVLERVDPRPPHFVFLVDESVFWRPVGGPTVMTRQIAHVIEVNKKENVEVLVVPQETGAYSGLLGSYVHIEFSGSRAEMSDILYIESQAGDALYNEDADEPLVERCLEQFNEISGFALEKDQLEDFLNNLLRSGWGWTRHL